MSIKRQHYTKRKSYNNITRKNQKTNTAQGKPFALSVLETQPRNKDSCDLPVKTAEMQ